MNATLYPMQVSLENILGNRQLHCPAHASQKCCDDRRVHIKRMKCMMLSEDELRRQQLKQCVDAEYLRTHRH